MRNFHIWEKWLIFFADSAKLTQRWFYKDMGFHVPVSAKVGDHKIIAPIFCGCLCGNLSFFFFCIIDKSCILSTVKHLNHTLVERALVLCHIFFLLILLRPSNPHYYCRGVDCTLALLYINEIVLFSSPVADNPSGNEFTLPGYIQVKGVACHLRNSS